MVAISSVLGEGSGRRQPGLAPWLFVAILLSVSAPRLTAQDGTDKPPGEPQITSVSPVGARQAATVQAEVRGRALQGAYGVWFDTEGLHAEVEGIGEIEFEAAKDYDPKAIKNRQGYRVSLKIEVDPDTPFGIHQLRLLTPQGISNSLEFVVTSLSSAGEAETPHNSAGTAQAVRIPTTIEGKIGQVGEVDFYSFEVSQGDDLAFEVFSNAPPGSFMGPPGQFDPELTLYEPSGSWFDPRKATRLAFNDEPTSPFVSNAPKLTYRFSKAGRYLVRVSSFMWKGSPDYSYQLRITPSESAAAGELAGEGGDSSSGAPGWRERAFERVLEADRLEQLWSRTVPRRAPEPASTPGGSAAGEARSGVQAEQDDLSIDSAVPLIVIAEEPNDIFSQALEVSVPTILEGAIERPGDVDVFKFKVDPGHGLAFEIETPEKGLPFFNPRLGVFDAGDNEFLTNIYKRIARNFTFYLKTVEPKTIYTFELGGEYYLQVRDVTSRYGDPSFRYRVLIRPQVPHAGDVTLQQTQVNLARGGAKKVTVTTDQEEGFGGEIALRVEGLPPGVDAVTGTEVDPDRGPPLDEGHKKRFVPKSQTAVIMLVASEDAPLTRWPKFIRVVARPIVDGKIGPPLPLEEIPLMIVESRKVSSGD